MLYVGTPWSHADIQRHQAAFNLAELVAVRARLPRLATLRRMAGAVRSDFAFSIRLPPRLFSASPSEQAETLAYAEQLGALPGARCIVLVTPADVRPTRRNKERLCSLTETVRRDSLKLCWEPHGLWEPEEAAAWAEDVGVVLVRDLSRDPAPPGSVVYTRVRALGTAARVTSGMAEHILETTRGADDVYVVLESHRGAKSAARLLFGEA